MSNPIRRLLANSVAWAICADAPALGVGALVVFWFWPEWCGNEPVHFAVALLAIFSATGSGPSAERSLRNIALFTAVTAATVAAGVVAAALIASCAGLAAWLGWHPTILQGIVIVVISVAGRVSYHWAAMRLGMGGGEAAGEATP